MKRLIVAMILFAGIACGSYAQKYALVDMEYILDNVSSYETANEQLDVISKKWQSEVDKVQQEAQNMYKSYQSDLAFLSPDQKTKRETEIVEKEKELQELKRKYFGPEGELFKKREALIKPIQDEIYEAIKEISEAKGYSVVVDRASATSIIFASPKIDISNEVLAKLGYTK
ncbi:OmpH family outer membrane protein [Dysgonomonas sp. 25]|uniref:OmpH family outer membrane protein n=1 Tax=Dysgonomonas sp. 25 TaxID=2302933 RepID=UPI0013D69AE4|nr:OmpH family outer membrane protein [Dysgonomonas sp. 25]NDV68658.1 OmpH family outer membrane protein [Dysgonomonas sp. 25]